MSDTTKAIVVKVPERHIILLGDKVLYSRTEFHAGDVARAHGATEVEKGDLECLNITYIAQPSPQPRSGSASKEKKKGRGKKQPSLSAASVGQSSGGSHSNKGSSTSKTGSENE